MILLQQVLSAQDINDTARLANGIWHEHFTPIIGEKQVNYMLDRFQSAPAIAEQIRQGYLYFALILDHRQIGYAAFRIDDDALFFKQTIYSKGIPRPRFFACRYNLCGKIGARTGKTHYQADLQ